MIGRRRSMRRVAAAAETRDEGVSIGGTVALAAAALVGPVTLASAIFANHDLGPRGDLAVAVAGAFVFLLSEPLATRVSGKLEASRRAAPEAPLDRCRRPSYL